MRKSDLAIVSKEIRDKLRMTVAVPAGTKEVRVPGLSQEQACLGEKRIQAIARMPGWLEAEMGAAVDVEFAIASGEAYLLQC